MKRISNKIQALITLAIFITFSNVSAQIGARFPSEKKVVKDPVTGTELTFLTSTPGGDSKIYQTHNQWTADGNWVIFRSNRVRGEAMAVNEKTGVIIQVSEGGYTGMLNVARKSMKLYFMRDTKIPRNFQCQISNWIRWQLEIVSAFLYFLKRLQDFIRSRRIIQDPFARGIVDR